MFRRTCQQWLTAASWLVLPRAHYQNFVISDALARLESQCERCCPSPRCTWQKVAVLGAGSDVGRYCCLFLKQQSVIKILAMYDECPQHGVLGVANDIAHIDTSTAIEAYQGRAYLKAALYNADVVLICGGCYVMPPCCNILDRDLFFQNQQHVRTNAIACAQFAPQAIVAVQTPPVDCNFSLCINTLNLYDKYDKRRVLGCNAVNSMRANQLYASAVNSDPSDSYVPVICGTGRCTRVPVWSATTYYYCVPTSQRDCLSRLVREADDLICRVKSNNEQGHLSIGFSTARFVTNIMKGLFEKPTFIDSALVEQDDPGLCYGMPICATPVTVGQKGIIKYHVPKLTDDEKELLEESKCDLEDMTNLGRCYAVGDDYCLHPCKKCPCYIPPPCTSGEVCQPCETENDSNQRRSRSK